MRFSDVLAHLEERAAEHGVGDDFSLELFLDDTRRAVLRGVERRYEKRADQAAAVGMSLGAYVKMRKRLGFKTAGPGRPRAIPDDFRERLDRAAGR